MAGSLRTTPAITACELSAPEDYCATSDTPVAAHLPLRAGAGHPGLHRCDELVPWLVVFGIIPRPDAYY